MLLRLMVVLSFFIYSVSGKSSVEVSESYNFDDPYKIRYPSVSTIWSINSLPIQPKDYIRLSDNLSYQDLFGDSSVGNLEFCGFLRRKLSIFDIGFGLGISSGFLHSSAYPGSSLAIDITSAKLRFWINTLTNEPYFVPFGGVEYWNIRVSESDGMATVVSQLPGVLIYRMGIQVLLNPIDSTAARNSLVEFGLQNTFLDLSYFMLAKKTEENFLTPLSGVSVGLSLEF